MKDLIIRSARPEDVSGIFGLIYELAVYEKAPQEVSNTHEKLLEDGFGDSPLYSCFIAELNKEIIGFALSYYRYSTWKGKCLYLEDFYVKEKHRRLSIGKLLFEKVLEKARAENCILLNWQVLDWNKPAIDFYNKYNSEFDASWLNGKITL